MKTFKVTKTYYNGQEQIIYIKADHQIEAELICSAYFAKYAGIKKLEMTYRNITYFYANRE